MRCSGCGVVLRDRPDACPLCGADLSPPEAAPTKADVDADDYHDHVRKLRAELNKLRDDAEAV